MSASESGQKRQIDNPDVLGAVISELRSLRRKTQFEVSSALGIDRSQLAHLEGGRSGRYLAHLLNILEHLGAELQIHWPDAPVEATPPLRATRPRSQVPPPSMSPAGSISPEAASLKIEDKAGVEPTFENESTSAQLTKITNLAMNVMAASQQLSVSPSRQPSSAKP
jgi:transcriptional regulator with XRE-family HTH domain